MQVSRLAIGVVAIASAGSAASAAITTFDVYLNGFNEVTAAGVPNQGDPDGWGLARLVIDDGVSPPTIAWNIAVFNITLPVIGAHIHQGASTTTGPVRVDFSGQLSGSGLADADLVGVLANPTGWYVNIHTSDFQPGAVRGQIPAPGALGLLALAAPVAMRRRR